MPGPPNAPLTINIHICFYGQITSIACKAFFLSILILQGSKQVYEQKKKAGLDTGFSFKRFLPGENRGFLFLINKTSFFGLINDEGFLVKLHFTCSHIVHASAYSDLSFFYQFL